LPTTVPVAAGKRYFKDPSFPKEGRFIASTRRHLYGDTQDTRAKETGHIDIGLVELWEDGAPGPRKLAIPMDDRPLRHGDTVRVWKSYRDARYHYEGDYR
jgi:hypothetical protein